MSGTVSRRGLLAGALGMAGLAGVVAACGTTPPPAPAGPSGSAAPPTTTTSSPGSGYVGDQRTVALCAALATLVADLYTTAVSVSGQGQGRLAAVPAPVTALLTGAAGQHTAAAQAWNQVLTAAGRPAVSGSPLTVEQQYRSRLSTVAAPVDLLGLVIDMETTVGATITAGMGRLTDPSAVAVGAGVAPVAAMHSATASFLLGRLPVPPADPTAGALGPEVLTA